MSDRAEVPTMAEMAALAESVSQLAERLVKAEAEIEALKEGRTITISFGAPLATRQDVQDAVRDAIARSRARRGAA